MTFVPAAGLLPIVMSTSMTTDTAAIAHVMVSPPARFGATPPTQLDPEEALFVPAVGLQAKVAACAAQNAQHIKKAISRGSLAERGQVEPVSRLPLLVEILVASDANRSSRGSRKRARTSVDLISGLTKSSAIGYSRYGRK